MEKKLSPLVFPLGSTDLIPPLSIIQYNLYLILALIYLIFTVLAILNIKFLKQPTNPLRLIKTTNVCVSGLTESSGTSFGQH